MTAGGIGGPDRPLEVVSAERRGAELPGHFKQQWISAVFLEHGVGERDGGCLCAQVRLGRSVEDPRRCPQLGPVDPDRHRVSDIVDELLGLAPFRTPQVAPLNDVLDL